MDKKSNISSPPVFSLYGRFPAAHRMPRLLQETLFETGKLRKYAAIPVVAAVAYWSNPANLFEGAEPWAITGLAIVWLGQFVRIWATGYIKKRDEVCQVGPYTIVRHPLYFGSMLMGIGFIVWGRNWPAAALMTLFWFLFYVPKMLREEQHMLDKFGDTYREYAALSSTRLQTLTVLAWNKVEKRGRAPVGKT
jgi:protein-S-isoprenylcysteine O-methyltransferase Ste14